MGRSQRLSLEEVKHALRLVGECRDLAHDPRAWLRHAAEGVQRLVKAKVVIGGIQPPEGFRLHRDVVLMVDAGFESAEQRRLALQYAAEEKQLQEAAFQRFALASNPNITVRPVRLIPRRDFRANDHYELRTRCLGIEDVIFSQRQGESGRISFGFAVHRAVRDPDFSAREARLMSLFHDELARLVGTVLADGRDDPAAGLSFRLRQTLEALLEGDSEKQVALRLGLSRLTVHDYVVELYRRFEVHSRAELLALFLRRRSVTPKAD